MQNGLQIHFHGMETSAALEARIRERCAELERRCPGLTGGRVTVEKESRNHVKGNLFKVGLVIHRPGRDLVVSRGGPKDQAHADVYVALTTGAASPANDLDPTTDSADSETPGTEVGMKIPDGQTVHVWIEEGTYRYLAYRTASGSGQIRLWPSSRKELFGLDG